MKCENPFFFFFFFFVFFFVIILFLAFILMCTVDAELHVMSVPSFLPCLSESGRVARSLHSSFSFVVALVDLFVWIKLGWMGWLAGLLD